MKQVTDELIMALVDGQLDGQLAKDVEAAIKNDPEASRKAEIFRQSAIMLREAFDGPLHQPVPERLINSVRQAKDKGANRTSRIREFVAGWLQLPKLQPALALVAVLLLVVGMVGGYFVSDVVSRKGKPSPVLLTGALLGRGLEKTISGDTFTIAGGGIRITPVATFKDKGGRYCRQYEILLNENGKQSFAQGVACRTLSGKWQVLVYMVSGAKGGAVSPDGSSYMPAGRNELFDYVLNKIIATPPLGQSQEKELISKGWKN